MSPISSFDCDVVLKDGSTLTLRAAGPDDDPPVLAFLKGLSERSRFQRFSGARELTLEAARQLARPEPGTGVALLGECNGRIVALAGFYSDEARARRAEVAFTIADHLQGKGIGTRLLERLADIARDQGIRTFDAFVLADNRAMLDVFMDSGFDVHQTLAGGTVHVTLSLKPSETFVERSASRAQTAATASLRPFFEPRSVAVVGANRSRGRIGSEILHNLIASGFRGTLHPVHPAAPELQGITTHPRVTDIPGPVDLAVVAVPAEQVLAVVDDCIAKGVRGICVISAGFGEANEAGRELEATLVEKVRSAGCRLIGPNCMGLLNTDPAVSLNATFSPAYPPAGVVAMSTQSGALGLAILDYARRLNIGISSFVSVGNKADVSGNDLLQYWAEDARTKVILLYLESFGNPRKFSQLARRIGRTKPIVAVKAGRSRSGARAAASHTGAMAVADTVVDALFRQAGVIRTDTLAELFDVSALLANQPLPRGRRVAILTNAGGPGILAADACEGHGLELASLSEETRSALRAFLPAAASVANPVDMLASASAEHFERATAAILADEGVDALLAIFIPPLVTEPDAAARAIGLGSRASGDKPVLGVFMRAEGAPPALAPIPCYPFPEPAAIALARVAAYADWQRTPASESSERVRIDEDAAAGVVNGALDRGEGWLTPDETQAVMTACGIGTPRSRSAATPEDAVAAAREVGFPVVVKGVGPAILHKTERQAVALDLRDDESVRRACSGLAGRLGADLAGFMVQQMVPGGVEMLVGATVDPLFGPLIVCGSGGVLVDLLGDSAVRLNPVMREDAHAMVNELRAARLLRGYRGATRADEEALCDVIERISALVDACPEIAELDINPVKVLGQGACAVDVRIRVERERPRPASRRVQY
jgi:acetyl coenzyme A synthetase (ADP forming)-like protein